MCDAHLLLYGMLYIYYVFATRNKNCFVNVSFPFKRPFEKPLALPKDPIEINAGSSSIGSDSSKWHILISIQILKLS